MILKTERSRETSTSLVLQAEVNRSWTCQFYQPMSVHRSFKLPSHLWEHNFVLGASKERTHARCLYWSTILFKQLFLMILLGWFWRTTVDDSTESQWETKNWWFVPNISHGPGLIRIKRVWNWLSWNIHQNQWHDAMDQEEFKIKDLFQKLQEFLCINLGLFIMLLTRDAE